MPADAPAAEQHETDAPPAAGGEPTQVPAEDVEALLAAAAEGSVELPPEEDEADGAAGGVVDEKDEEHEQRKEQPPGDPAGTPGHEPDVSKEHGSGPNTAAAQPQVGGQVEKLLEEVEAGLRGGRPAVVAAGEAAPADLGAPTPLELEAFAESAAGAAAGAAGGGGELGALDDVELDLRIELGRTRMRLDEVVGLRDGSVVTLDKLAGDPVDVLVNGRLVARGEVLVLNDNFCVRVAEILAPDR